MDELKFDGKTDKNRPQRGRLLGGESCMSRELWREVLAEFLGTFVLIMFGAGVVAQVVLGKGDYGGYLSINLGWGLAVTMGAYVAGGVSGAHLNPAVTMALALHRGFSWRKVLPYTVAQLRRRVRRFGGRVRHVSRSAARIRRRHASRLRSPRDGRHLGHLSEQLSEQFSWRVRRSGGRHGPVGRVASLPSPIAAMVRPRRGSDRCWSARLCWRLA